LVIGLLERTRYVGTNIDLCVERRVDEVWSHVWPATDEITLKDAFARPNPWADPFAIGRNYPLFAILGGAGRLSDQFQQMVPTRGIPNDVSSETRAWMDSSLAWEDDAFGHSWATLRELIELDWSRVLELEGYVSKSEYAMFRERGHPTTWSPASWGVGRGLILVSNDEMEEALSAGSEAKGAVTFIRWRRTYRDCVGPWLFDVMIPALFALGQPDDVRLIFFFDS
jgi:hypothetical protein